MQFHRSDPPRTAADFLAVNRHWESLGWTPMTSADEADVRAAWIEGLQPGRDLVLPLPRRTWDLRRLGGLDDRELEAVEADFTFKALAAFRRIIPLGERLLAIDWQHQWYFFDPYGGVSEATRDEWAMPIMPLGDSYHFLTPDFRSGVSGDCVGQTLRMFGLELLDVLDRDPPRLFNDICPCRQEAC